MCSACVLNLMQNWEPLRVRPPLLRRAAAIPSPASPRPTRLSTAPLLAFCPTSQDWNRAPAAHFACYTRATRNGGCPLGIRRFRSERFPLGAHSAGKLSVHGLPFPTFDPTRCNLDRDNVLGTSRAAQRPETALCGTRFRRFSLLPPSCVNRAARRAHTAISPTATDASSVATDELHV